MTEPVPPSPAAPPAAAAQPKRVRKRILIPTVLLLILLGAFVFLYVRGTWADAVEKNPAQHGDGTRTQLLRKVDDAVWVRCAILVQAPPRNVWDVVSDYANHPKFVPYVTEIATGKGADGRIQMKGVAHSRLWGDWPFESLVTHEEGADRFAAHWDEKDGEFLTVNRGRWDVQAQAADSLLVFSLQIETANYPNFLIRNILMDRMHSIVKAMREEVYRRKNKKT